MRPCSHYVNRRCCSLKPHSDPQIKVEKLEVSFSKMPLTESGSKFHMYKSPKVWYNRLRNRGSRWSTAGLGRVWQQRQNRQARLQSFRRHQLHCNSSRCGNSPSLNHTSCKSRPFHSRVRTHTYVISCKSCKKLPFHSRVHVCTKQQLDELQQSLWLLQQLSQALQVPTHQKSLSSKLTLSRNPAETTST